MKKFFFSILASFSLLTTSTYAAASKDNWLGISNTNLRNGNVGFETIPEIIVNITEFLLWLIGSVSVVVIIYWAVRMGYGSVSNDKETGKKIITAWISGFVLALSGWFIINLIIANL